MDATHRWLVDVILMLVMAACTGALGWIVKRVGEAERNVESVRAALNEGLFKVHDEISSLERSRFQKDIETARTLGRIEQKLDDVAARLK